MHHQRAAMQHTSFVDIEVSLDGQKICAKFFDFGYKNSKYLLYSKCSGLGDEFFNKFDIF